MGVIVLCGTASVDEDSAILLVQSGIPDILITILKGAYTHVCHIHIHMFTRTCADSKVKHYIIVNCSVFLLSQHNYLSLPWIVVEYF